jgi:hypothetical protein
MSSPLESPEFGGLYLGNTHDDDGQVIDSLVQEVDSPATPVTEPIRPAALIQPKRTTRILSGTLIFDNTQIANYAPIQILPADFNRQQFNIKGFSYVAAPTITDFVFIVDENGKVNTSSAGRLRSGQSIALDEHTGSLWVYPNPTITGLFEITYWSTTL